MAASQALMKTRLRILATSDLHMQITAFDYTKNKRSRGGSLAKLATEIAKARLEAKAQNMTCILLDNGDTLQGTPMADYIARQDNDQIHAMVACMNHLAYDAGGLGNHDFDHGLDNLAACLAQHKMPVVCTNLRSDSLPMLQRHAILDRKVQSSDGTTDSLRIGILSSLPDKTAHWSRHHVEHRAEFQPPLPVLRKQAAELRHAGADLIVVLAHMGLALFDEGEDSQNLISDVAAIEDVDVVIGGHTHLRFPGKCSMEIPFVDWVAGKVRGKPVVQPGVSGSDLGVIDLFMERARATDRWRMAESKVRLQPVTELTPEDTNLTEIARDTHTATCRHLSEPVANLQQPINSFFALAHPSTVSALLAGAKQSVIASAAQGTKYASLPLLASASVPLTGGFDGPDNFVKLERGQINFHDVAGINPYANYVWAVETNGAQLLDWLERSATIFNTLDEGRSDQMLVDPRVPGFRFDSIYGITYEIDPRRPAKFDVSGRPVAGGGRIRNLRWQGSAIQHDQSFLVATTDHRAGGGGLYQPFASKDIAIRGDTLLKDAVVGYLRDSDGGVAPTTPEPWRFVPDLNRTATLLTAPEASHHLNEIAFFEPEISARTDDGFLPVLLHL